MNKAIKTKDEIRKIEKACKLTDKTFQYLLTIIKKGITEKELSFKIQKFIRKNYAKLSFRPIVAFGKNSSEVHHKPTDKKLKINEIVMLDLGAKVDGYCGDLTRTIIFGKATEKQKKIYHAVLKAQEKAIEFLNRESCFMNQKNIRATDVDEAARKFIINQGYPTIPHGLGHGVGRIVHQAPRLSPKSKAILKPGMVFSIEPGIYIKDFGGVRIEDLVLLTKSGPHLLTHSSKALIELS